MNLTLIDPNKAFNENKLIPQTEDLSIDVHLSTIRNGSSQTIGTGELVRLGDNDKESVSFMNGQKFSDGQYLSTFFTEIGSEFDIIGENLDLETLGITGVEVNFNASNMPIVTINMVDVRGRLLSMGDKSPFSVFYEIPYPLFKLRLKGYYGKAVEYDLHLLKFNTTFNSNYGGFEIKCEFTGHTYAYLSDLLMGYLKGVVYTNIGKSLIKPEFQHIKDYENNALKLFETLQENVKAGNIGSSAIGEDSKNKLSELSDQIYYKIENLSGNNIINEETSTTKRTWYNDSKNGYYIIVNNGDNGDTDRVGFNAIINEITTLLETPELKDLNLSIETQNTCFIRVGYENDNFTYNNFSDSFLNSEFLHENKPKLTNGSLLTIIDLSKVFGPINEKINELSNAVESAKKNEVEILENGIYQDSIDVSIGGYFKMLGFHSDIFYETLKKVGDNINNNSSRKKQFKSIDLIDDGTNNGTIKPFPLVKTKRDDGSSEDGWIGDYVVDGVKNEEAEFVEELIQGIIKAKKVLNDVANKTQFEADAENTSTTLSFIPIYPGESPITLPSNSGTISNPYLSTNSSYDKYLTKLSDRSDRWLNTFRLKNSNTGSNIPDELLEDLAKVEAFNISKGLINDSNMNDLIKTKVNSEVSGEIKIMGNIVDSKSSFISDLAESHNKASSNAEIPLNNYYTLDTDYIQYENGYDVPNIVFNINGVPNKENVNSDADKSFIFKHDLPSTSKIINVDFLDVESNIMDGYDDDLHHNKINPTYGALYVDKLNHNGDLMDLNLSFYNNQSILVSGGEKYSFFSSKEVTSMVNSLSSVTYISDFEVRYKDKFGINVSWFGDNGNKMNKYERAYSDSVSFVDGLTNSSVYLSDLPILLNGNIVSLQTSQLFNLQETIEAKAFLFLHSLPFRLDTNNELSDESFYFGNNIETILRNRIGVYKTSFAWVALMGGIIKHIKGEIKILTSSSLIHNIIAVDDDFTELSNGGKRYIKKEYSLISVNSSEVFEESGLGISLNRKNNGLISLKKYPKRLINTPKEFLKSFEDAWDEFMDIFKNTIYPNLNIFKSGAPTNTNSMYALMASGCSGEMCAMDLSDDPNISPDLPKNYAIFGYNKKTKTISSKFKNDSPVSLAIQDLITKYVYMINNNPNIFNGAPDPTFSGPNNIFIGDAIKYYELLAIELNNILINTQEESQKSINEFKDSLGMLNNSKDLKIKIYNDLKSIYDKWVLADDKQGFDLYSKFKFQDRVYNDISNTFKINPIKMIRDLATNLHQPLISHISKVLSENNFLFLPTPAYVNIHDVDEMRDLFKPYRWVEQDYTTESMFVCIYVGQYSNTLDLGPNSNYRSDGIKMDLIQDYDDVKISSIDAPDFLSTDHTIPIIRVRFGDSNQSIFTNFGMEQSEFTITNESLIVTDNLTKNSGISQGLYSIYLNRSYTINLELLGNVTVQPFMYLYLDNVPMFFGLYQIIEVSHNFSANSSKTNIKAIRMRNTRTKLLDVETLYYDLMAMYEDSIYESSKNGSGSINTGNPSQYITSKVTDTESLINAVNVVNRDGREIDESYLLPEVHEWLKEVAQTWYFRNNEHRLYSKVLHFTAGSVKGGGNTPLHSSHQTGVDIDLRLLTNDYNNNTGLTVSDPKYSTEATKILLDICKEIGAKPKYSDLVGGKNFFELMAVQDPELVSKGLVKNWKNHHHHYHLRVRVPVHYSTKSTGSQLGSYPSDVSNAIIQLTKEWEQYIAKAKLDANNKYVIGYGSQYLFSDNPSKPREVMQGETISEEFAGKELVLYYENASNMKSMDSKMRGYNIDPKVKACLKMAGYVSGGLQNSSEFNSFLSLANNNNDMARLGREFFKCWIGYIYNNVSQTNIDKHILGWQRRARHYQRYIETGKIVRKSDVEKEITSPLSKSQVESL